MNIYEEISFINLDFLFGIRFLTIMNFIECLQASSTSKTGYKKKPKEKGENLGTCINTGTCIAL